MDVSMMVTPNITSMSMAKAENMATQEIGVAVMDKALDNYRDSGANMIKMMEQSVNPHIGGNFDMSV